MVVLTNRYMTDYISRRRGDRNMKNKLFVKKPVFSRAKIDRNVGDVP